MNSSGKNLPAGRAGEKQPVCQADRIAEALRQAGVRFAFGVPGGEVLTLIEAFGRAGIQFVTARQESAAGFMAEGAAHVDDSPAVLLATLGPGVANAINVAAHALQDAVPLIVIGGAVARSERPAYSHQVLDQLALFEPVTKACFELDPSKEDASELMARVLSIARSEPPGPVYLDCAVDAVEVISDFHAATAIKPPQGLSAVDDDASALARAATSLAKAKTPLVLAGLHAMRPGVSEALLAFAEAQQAFVMTSYKAKGLMPENHPLALGGVGLSPRADAMVLPILAESDFALLLGYDPIEMRANWTRALPPNEVLFQFSDVPLRDGVAYAPATRGGDPGAALANLTQVPLCPDRWADGSAEKLRRNLREAFRPQSAWEPQVLFAVAQKQLAARDYTLCVDTGAHRILLSQSWSFQQPGRILHSTGFCTMACALPLGIGTKLAAPKRDVVVVVGDGGLDMGLGELCTLRDLDLGVVVVVVDDQSLALIDMKQRARGFVRSGVDLGPCDYAAVADALGGHGQLVENADEFGEALIEGLSRRGFTLIHAPFAKGTYDGRF